MSTATPPRDPQPQNSTRRRPDITRPDTITDAAQIAHDLVMRRTNDDPELAATIVAAVNGQPDLSTSHKEARTNV